MSEDLFFVKLETKIGDLKIKHAIEPLKRAYDEETELIETMKVAVSEALEKINNAKV